MGYIISVCIAVGIIAAAAWILIKRFVSYKRTCGRSACENCPWSGTCNSKDK